MIILGILAEFVDRQMTLVLHAHMQQGETKVIHFVPSKTLLDAQEDRGDHVSSSWTALQNDGYPIFFFSFFERVGATTPAAGLIEGLEDEHMFSVFTTALLATTLLALAIAVLDVARFLASFSFAARCWRRWVAVVTNSVSILTGSKLLPRLNRLGTSSSSKKCWCVELSSKLYSCFISLLSSESGLDG